MGAQPLPRQGLPRQRSAPGFIESAAGFPGHPIA